MRGRRSGVLAALLAFLGASIVPGASAAPTFDEYVALGDSWTADVSFLLATTDQAPLGCLQSSRNYPRQIAATLHVRVFRDASCAGADTLDLTTAQSAWFEFNVPQLDRLTPTTDLVTLGIGGNDAGLVYAALGCLNIDGSNAPCRSAWTAGGTDRMSGNIRNTEPKIVSALEAIRARSPQARILLVNFLAAVTPGSSCFPTVPIPAGDAEWLGEKLIELNTMLARAADQAGVEVVDTYSSSIGHDACQPPGVRWVEGLVPMSNYPPGVAVPFHPNQLGADHQALAILEALGG